MEVYGGGDGDASSEGMGEGYQGRFLLSITDAKDALPCGHTIWMADHRM